MRQGIYGRCPGELTTPAWPFREISRREVGGGSKTFPADEITWTGRFHDAPITFTTTPRLVTPHASFLVPSNARLRTSLLKRDQVYFIDLCVRDRTLSDEERAELAAIAQAHDADRPVRVRHKGEPVRGTGDRTRVRAPAPIPQDSQPTDPEAQFRLL